MAYTYYRAYEFTRLIVQRAADAIAATSATDTITAGSAHGLAVGDTVSFSENGGATITENQRYFVVAVPSSTTFKISATEGGSPITVGSGTALSFQAIVETRIYFANQAQLNPQTTDYTWEGDAQQITLSLLRGMTLTLAADAIPASAHADIFEKTAITGALPGGGTNGKGYGGGNDKSGVSCGIRLEGNAVKVNDGVESTVTIARWFPQGTLTLTGPAGFQTGQKAGTTGYTFTPSRTLVDVLGATIAGASSDGEFFIDYEL